MSGSDSNSKSYSDDSSSFSQLDVVWDFRGFQENDYHGLKFFLQQLLAFDNNWYPFLAGMAETICSQAQIGAICTTADTADNNDGCIDEAVNEAYGFSSLLSLKEQKTQEWMKYFTTTVSSNVTQEAQAVVSAAFQNNPALLLTNRIPNLPGSLTPPFYQISLSDADKLKEQGTDGYDFGYFLIPVAKIAGLDYEQDDEAPLELTAGAARPPEDADDVEITRVYKAPEWLQAQIQEATNMTGMWVLPEQEILVTLADALLRVPLHLDKERDSSLNFTAAYIAILSRKALDAAIKCMWDCTTGGTIIPLE